MNPASKLYFTKHFEKVGTKEVKVIETEEKVTKVKLTKTNNVNKLKSKRGVIKPEESDTKVKKKIRKITESNPNYNVIAVM